LCQASCASELKRNITAPAKAGEALGVQEFAAADDGGSPNCVDTRQEDVMVLVLNHDDDPLEHGFSDVGSNGLYHGLIVRGIDAGTTYNYQRLWAYEFRYDGGRERYLARRLNPANPDPTAQGGILDETWTDYDLDGSVYGDYQVAGGGTVTELQRYVPGLAQQSVAGAAEYFLGDQIGTTRFLTDGSTPVAATNRRVYTAFGELVEMTGTGQTRYGYAGAWGYQEHDADGAGGPDNILGSPPTGPAIGEVFPFLHVGARYYDPSTGRFLQRDPIGIFGGPAVYVYAGNSPTFSIDPSGLKRIIVIVGGGEVVGTDGLIAAIANKGAKAGDDVRVIRTKKKKTIKAIVGDDDNDEIIFIGHGGGPPKGIKADSPVLVPDPDSFGEDISPDEVAGWRKGAKLRLFDARSCYQGARGHRKAWQDAFGPVRFRGKWYKCWPLFENP
jgi:RHS repeat-associated protein